LVRVILVCAQCGQSLDDSTDERAALDALAWMTSRENGRELRLCPGCARVHLRAIEGKLDVAL
jgi:hypothetical protein